MVKSKKLVVSGLIVLSTLGLIIAIESFSGAPTPPSPAPINRYAPPTQASRPKTNPTFCGSISTKCKVKAKLELEQCSPSRARKKISDILKNPAEARECKQADQDLLDRCPERCSFDYASRLALTSPIHFSYAPPSPDGSCTIRGERTITFRGNCGS